MEHHELIAEMQQVEQLPTPERLMLAKRRRNQQLKVWKDREKEYSRKSNGKQVKSQKRGISFNDSVVLLEAAARNDIDEGMYNYFWLVILTFGVMARIFPFWASFDFKDYEEYRWYLENNIERSLLMKCQLVEEAI